MAGWGAIVITLAYNCALFAVAYFGDARRIGAGRGLMRSAVYALSLAIYCTGWTFFGSVGLASHSGLAFLPIYIGPLLVLIFGGAMIERIARLAKNQNITSVADFVAARYGKAESVAICVAVVCIIGVAPYIALQLKAISSALSLVLDTIEAHGVSGVNGVNGVSGFNAVLSSKANVGALFKTNLAVAVALACFAMAFGTRRVEATEHQNGLMLAIAIESIIKLVAFLAVGVAVTFYFHDGWRNLWLTAERSEPVRAVFESRVDWASLTTMTLLSAFAIILLPRQFHVMIVENRDDQDIKPARWLFAVYLVAINVFVAPLAVGGLIDFPDAAMIDRDMTVLALPLQAGRPWLALLAMIGGVSAATAMIVVECVALSITFSNDLFLPLYLRGRRYFGVTGPSVLGGRILIVRRVAIVIVLTMGFAYLQLSSSQNDLAAIGLLSFACISQIAPAFFGGLVWRGGTASGALAGIVVGVATWFYTLFLPSMASHWVGAAASIRTSDWLRSVSLFGIELPLFTNGALLSLTLNLLVFVGVSLWRKPSRIELLQAANFVRARETPTPGTLRFWRTHVTTGELEATLSRYLGEKRARSSFDAFYASRGMTRVRSAEADVHALRFAEKLLASAIGAASSRLVLSLILGRRNVSHQAALRLVDEASAAIQYNRDLLQYALDFARQGISVFDGDQRLICWNREYRDLFDLPQQALSIGVELQEIIRFNAQRGYFGPGDVEEIVARIVRIFSTENPPTRVRLEQTLRVIEIRSAPMPNGGFVTTYADVSAQVVAEEALEATNETLELRVRERTNELLRLNVELEAARAAAEEANVSKTRFLAAASHDLLQPLNSARLYATSLSELAGGGVADSAFLASLAQNVDVSLEAVEEILTTLLDISRLDAGAMKAEFAPVALADIFAHLKIEFAPAAQAKALDLKFVETSAIVLSDRRLLRRLLQNFVSNAIKYTQQGRVLVGVRGAGAQVRVSVFDTGIGIAQEHSKDVFREFARLDSAKRSAPGVGLGLSIVERLARVLNAEIEMVSEPNKGSIFSVVLSREKKAPVITDPSETLWAAAGSLSGFVIAAIDNDPRIVDAMEAMLSNWGCIVVSAGAIHELLQRLEARGQKPNVVIADYQLDNEDGLQAIAAVRERFGAAIPAILSTADRSDGLRVKTGDLGVQILSKPLKPASLRALLSQWARAENFSPNVDKSPYGLEASSLTAP